MDYYEEFGVSPDASLEEIRQAHKRLARLLHPDQLQDPELRRLAECQMKRLNAIYSVLADPERRREYDLARQRDAAGIVSPLLPVETAAAPAGQRRNLVWTIAAAACALTLYWTFAHYPARGPQAAGLVPPGRAAIEPPRPSPETPRTPAPNRRRPPAGPAREASQAPAAPDGSEAEELRAALKQAEAQRDAALAQMARLKLSLTELRRAGESPEPGSEPALASVAAPPAPSGPRLAGTWFYVPQTVDFASKDMYPPEYIDLTISEENGLVRGRYWARYRVPDRAISPEVFFRFQGEANESGLYSWTGRGGAHGEVRLRLISDETLEVVWLASELGRQMGLGSGTAVLTRQKRPERY
jgi:curved DNA-binding protein CbpA